MTSVETLKELIRFPSVSSESNVEISRWIEGKMQGLGFHTEWLQYSDPKGVPKACVSGRLGPASGRGVAYFCHTDVVPATSWSFPKSGPWQPHEQDGRIYGRGSCDMKGSLACALAAAERISADQLKQPFYIVCTADEETGFHGARHLVEKSAFYREIVSTQPRGLVGEPTMLGVVHAHKGGRALTVTSHGVAAHSSTGEGHNANIDMIPFLEGLRSLCEETESDPDWQDDRFEPPTISLNFSVNDHSPALNITAAKCDCGIYFRTMPDDRSDEVTDRLLALAQQCKLDVSNLFSADPMYTAPSSEFVQEMLELSGTSESRTVSYGTDGACFTELQDVVVIGPGDIRQAHTDDEWISLEQLELGTDLYLRAIRRWCL